MIPVMRSRYSAGLRRIHWLTVVLVAAAYILVEQRGLFPRGSDGRTLMLQGHFLAGLSVFAFALWRIALRVRNGTPPVSPALPAWQSWSARALHLALYAFVLLMPLLGLATAWTTGKAVTLPFTDLTLSSPLAVDKVLGHRLEDLHGTIGEVFYWIIGLHVVAALYHHLWRRDDTLRRML